MKVRVKENCTGYFGDVRRRAGEVFDMPDANVVPLDDNGKPLVDSRGKIRICAWVEPVNPDNLDALLKKLGAPKVEAKPEAPKAKAEPKAPEAPKAGERTNDAAVV